MLSEKSQSWSLHTVWFRLYSINKVTPLQRWSMNQWYPGVRAGDGCDCKGKHQGALWRWDPLHLSCRDGYSHLHMRWNCLNHTRERVNETGDIRVRPVDRTKVIGLDLPAGSCTAAMQCVPAGNCAQGPAARLFAISCESMIISK